MKAKKINRIIEVDVIEINGKEYDAKDIIKFFNEVDDFVDYIDKDDNCTSEYLYFNTYNKKEAEIEKLLLELGIIKRNQMQHKHNTRVDNGEYKDYKNDNHIAYLLTEKYNKFYDDVWEVLNEYYK